MFSLGSKSAERPAGREHIPIYPAYLVALRAVQLVVTIIVLGLDAYGLSVIDFSGDELMMFTVVASLIIIVYNFVALLAAPAAYNYWAVLACDILLVIFWLVSFALLASQIAPFMKSGTYCGYLYCYSYGLEGADKVVADCLAAASGLGGLNFLLFVITLVIQSIAIHHHRAGGLHSMPGQAATPPAGVNGAEMASAHVAAATAVPLQPIAPQPVAPFQPQPHFEQQAQQQQVYYQQPSIAGTPQPGQPNYPPQQPTPVAAAETTAYYPPQFVSPVPQGYQNPSAQAAAYYPPQTVSPAPQAPIQHAPEQ